MAKTAPHKLTSAEKARLKDPKSVLVARIAEAIRKNKPPKR